MNKIFLHNIIKNVIVLIILFFTWKPLYSFLILIDDVSAGSVLVAVSILALVACFGSYTFTYEKTEKNQYWCILSHLTTGLLALSVGWSLQMIAVLVENLVGPFGFFRFMLVIIYVSLVMYDFWDLNRIENRGFLE